MPLAEVSRVWSAHLLLPHTAPPEAWHGMGCAAEWRKGREAGRGGHTSFVALGWPLAESTTAIQSSRLVANAGLALCGFVSPAFASSRGCTVNLGCATCFARGLAGAEGPADASGHRRAFRIPRMQLSKSRAFPLAENQDGGLSGTKHRGKLSTVAHLHPCISSSCICWFSYPQCPA